MPGAWVWRAAPVELDTGLADGRHQLASASTGVVTESAIAP